MNKDLQEALGHTYRICGEGGQGACIAVQSVLQEFGFCGYTDWTSPSWRFLYLTQLEPQEVLNLLGDLSGRFKITIKTTAQPCDYADTSLTLTSFVS